MAHAPRILIVYAAHSSSTARLAEAAERGATADGGEVRRLRGTEAGLDDLLWCEALVVATPENFGYMAGAVKDFFDRSYEGAQGRVDQLPYALIVRAGNDGSFARAAVERIARGYAFRAVAEPVLSVGDAVAGPLARAEEIGQLLVAGLEAGIFGRAARPG